MAPRTRTAVHNLFKEMKKLITLTVMCLVAIAAVAQENLAVKYTVSNRDTDSGKPYSYEMVLVANPQKSLYYNTESLFCDSCNSTPEGKAKLHEIQMKISLRFISARLPV